MNFELTEEQKMTQNMVREFANDVIRPRAMEIDKEGKFPEDIFKEMGKLGFLGIPFPEEYGGREGTRFLTRLQSKKSEERAAAPD